jgi:hypothetical protein
MAATEEVAEHVHEAHEPFDKLVAGTMAIIAALLAVVSVLGQHFTTEKVVNQQLASDQWAYYQAKDIRRYVAQVAEDDLVALKAPPAVLQKYSQDVNRYKSQSDSIQEKAHDYENERNKAGAQAGRLHFGEVFLEIAIVFSSLAILIRRKPFFLAGVASAVIGIVISITAYWA